MYTPLPDGSYEKTAETDLNKLPENTLVFWKTVEKNYVDLLNPAVTEAFITYIYEPYRTLLKEYFGKTVKGFFTDEPQMNTQGLVWSSALEKAFCEETGEDFSAKLWMIAAESREALSFRNHLWKLIGTLYTKNFVKRISDWCASNQVMFTGHFPAEDGLTTQLPACGDLMVNYTHMQLPAIDHLGSRVASPVLMKQAASIARQYHCGDVMSETFGCAGWGVTFKQLEWIWGGQSVLGITKPCYHLSAFSMEGRRKRDYPAFYSYQEPWWDEFRSFSQWMRRLNTLMTEGKRDLHTLVISPMTSIRAFYRDDYHDNTKAQAVSAQFRCLVENLLDLQLDFDIGDEMLVCRDAVVSDGQIRVGQVRYDTVVLADSPVITREMYQLLKRVSDDGIRIFVINRYPERFADGGMCVFPLPHMMVLQNRRDTLDKYIEYFSVDRGVTVLKKDTLKVETGLRIHVRTVENGKRIHIWAGDSFSSKDAYLSFEESAVPYEVNLLDGTSRPLPVYWNWGKYIVPIQVRQKENLLIELRPYGERPTCHPVLTRKELIHNVNVVPESGNCITLDYAAVSMDGGRSFGEKKRVIDILDEIYSNDRKEKMDLTLRYEFDSDMTVIPPDMSLAFEDVSYEGICINGRKYFGQRNGWWIDHCIGIYPIQDFVAKGRNCIDIQYTIPAADNGKCLHEEFETERNRFYYPVEPESIYIRGSFDVKTDGRIGCCGECYSIEGNYCLTDSTPKKIGDVTAQNMWFYRGNLTYCFDVLANRSERTVIAVEEYHGTMVVLCIGSHRLVSHENPARIDITDYLSEGLNKVSLELIGNNRNLLGPHHYIHGESRMVCPATYEGRPNSLSEFLEPSTYGQSTSTNRYSFMPFGIVRIEQESYKTV